MVDGKPQNAFGMDEKAMDRDYTLKVRPAPPRLMACVTRPAWLARWPVAPLRYHASRPLVHSPARPFSPARPCSPLLTLSRPVPRRAGDTGDQH